MKVLLLLPNQLFKTHDIKYDKIILYEHPKFFTKFKYHKSKLVFLRASMKSYYDSLKSKNNISYIDFNEKLNIKDDIIIYDPTDFEILKDIINYCKSHKLKLDILDNKLFLLSLDEIDEYINTTKKPYFNATFYKWIRIKKNILIKNNKPIGGQWSFDKYNRLPFNNNYHEDNIKFINNKYIDEATTYINTYFKNNYGEINIFLPINHEDAYKYYQHFITKKLSNFGKYEDAISSEVIIGYHSSISGLLNIGLLDVNDVIQMASKKKDSINIESLEGFIRQIVSWREYVRMLYVKEHNKFITMNFFNHHNKLNKNWYNGNTGLLPVDNVIKKALTISYAHHIERLMIIGNIMLLMMISPKEVYKWFIELISIDAYEWVMEPNIYGMSQHSVGDLMMNRPYFSSSNYIIKMSNYKKNKNNDWWFIWDSLYYNFINKHKNYLIKNYSTASSVYNLNLKSDNDKKKLFNIAKSYINS